ncbi:MAG: antibiotic biosynthesis monooxygenase [Rhizobiales bacterium 65-9]|nr:antibiotic biosynthesis monooxygenase [Hyphomicrobiales bacterium]OJY34266.1 MAG: antibiotic biosynthesis monooxygenase [Rhizobiales bacterium 65-9]
MYIAMNRFKVSKGNEEAFETLWRSRESYLHELPGFQEFSLLKGPEKEDHTLYSSHTVWNSFADFKNWTTSEQFRKAHSRAGGANKPLHMGHPEFEGFQAVLIQRGGETAPSAA